MLSFNTRALPYQAEGVAHLALCGSETPRDGVPARDLGPGRVEAGPLPLARHNACVNADIAAAMNMARKVGLDTQCPGGFCLSSRRSTASWAPG